MNIKHLIKSGESERLDFKENFMKEAIETVVAFANTVGGQMLIGVNDKGIIKGVTLSKETTKNWINEISQAIEPKITISMHVEKSDEANIVVVNVPEAPIKPIGFKGRCYRRSATSNKPMTPSEIAEMHLFSTGASWDAFECNAAINDIDPSKVKKYATLAIESGRRNFKEDSKTILKKIDIIKKRPTWAGILLFGKEPQKLAIQSAVHCGKFKLDKTQILDDLMIRNDLIAEVDEAIGFIKKHISVRYDFEGTPRRKEVWEYPLSALREAVINAIVHRDYAVSANVQIEIYEDRIQIWSPGKLPSGLRIEDLYNPEHKSIIRNKLIAQVFYDIGLIEKYGSGTGRIIELCKEHGLPEPEFREDSIGFSTTFRKDTYTERYLKELGLNERQVNSFIYIKKKKKISNKEYRNITGLSDEGARKDLKIMVEKGLLKPIGKGRAASFIVK